MFDDFCFLGGKLFSKGMLDNDTYVKNAKEIFKFNYAVDAFYRSPRRIFISEKEPRKKVKNRGRNSRPSIKQVVEERELTDDLIEKLTNNNEFREMQEDYVAYALRLKRSWLTSAMNTVNLPTFDEMLTGFIDPPAWWLSYHVRRQR